MVALGKSIGIMPPSKATMFFARVLGVLSLLVGGAGGVSELLDGNFVLGIGGLGVAVAGVAHASRPSACTLGTIELLWGACVLVFEMQGRPATTFDLGANGPSILAVTIGVVLVLAGAWTLLRARAHKQSTAVRG